MPLIVGIRQMGIQGWGVVVTVTACLMSILRVPDTYIQQLTVCLIIVQTPLLPCSAIKKNFIHSFIHEMSTASVEKLKKS